VGTRFSAPVQNNPVAHLASCTVGSVSFLGAKEGDVTLTLLAPRLKKEWNYISTPRLCFIGRILTFNDSFINALYSIKFSRPTNDLNVKNHMLGELFFDADENGQRSRSTACVNSVLST
jgi:hypothetical protein